MGKVRSQAKIFIIKGAKAESVYIKNGLGMGCFIINFFQYCAKWHSMCSWIVKVCTVPCRLLLMLVICGCGKGQKSCSKAKIDERRTPLW